MKKIIHQLLVVGIMGGVGTAAHAFDFRLTWKESKLVYKDADEGVIRLILTNYVELFRVLSGDPEGTEVYLPFFEEQIGAIDPANVDFHSAMACGMVEMTCAKYPDLEEQKKHYQEGCNGFTYLRDVQLTYIANLEWEIAMAILEEQERLQNEGRFKRFGRRFMKSIGNSIGNLCEYVDSQQRNNSLDDHE